jgi:hypothetical protein
MASKRRGGFRPPELRGTLGTLIRTTTGVVRDALERGAREGRARLDDALERGVREGRALRDGARASRRRRDALADLGDLVLDLIRRGEIDLAELPEARDLVRELDDLDDATAGSDDDDAPEPPRIASRRRFDDRGPPPAPPPPRRAADADDDRPPPPRRPAVAAEDDGTVSSGAAPRPTRGAPDVDAARPGDSPSTRAPTRPMKGMWRPGSDDAPSPPDRRARVERWDATQTGPMLDRRTSVERWDASQTAPISRAQRRAPTDPGAHSDRHGGAAQHRADGRDGGDERDRRPDRDARDSRGDSDHERPRSDRERDRTDRPERSDAPLPHDPTRKGGITFDDEDLADYMHPDDVPPRPPAKDPDDHDA